MRGTVRWMGGKVFAGALLAGVLSWAACGDDDKADTDTTADTADTGSPDVADTTADTADTGAPDVADTSPTDTADSSEPADTSPVDAADVTAITRFADIHQIFVNSCGACHTGATASSGSGGHALGAADVAVAYQASQKAANIAKCSGKTVGECALIRIKDGSMPATGDCATTPKGAKCPTLEMQDAIQAWIDDGQKP